MRRGNWDAQRGRGDPKCTKPWFHKMEVELQGNPNVPIPYFHLLNPHFTSKCEGDAVSFTKCSGDAENNHCSKVREMTVPQACWVRACWP